jgi:hypothetical protein
MNDNRTVRHTLFDGGLTAVGAIIGTAIIGPPTFVPIAPIAPKIAIVVSFGANRHSVFPDRNAYVLGDCRGGAQQNARGRKAYQDIAHFDRSPLLRIKPTLLKDVQRQRC